MRCSKLDINSSRDNFNLADFPILAHVLDKDKVNRETIINISVS